MSQALSYLIQARPEAMSAYFEFLKKAGDRLDVRTRDLISVITKVAVKTEKGLRQYVNRALKDGCTADEILDALLMAFPALGLAKIVWAVDILLQMDLDDFRLENLGGGVEWHDVAALADVPVGETSWLEAGDRRLFVHRTADGIRVFDACCPHQGKDIPPESAAAGRIRCPNHGWTFDPESGKCLEPGDRPLRPLDHKEEDGWLLVRW